MSFLDPAAKPAPKKPKTRGPVKHVGTGVAEALEVIFSDTYRELRPRAPMPSWDIRFYRFAHVNNTIRLREGKIYARLSDVLQAAPESVLRAIAHILLAKLYRKPVSPLASARFRRHVNSESVSRHAEHIRQSRGHKRLLGAQGETYDLNEVFDSLNRQFFHGLMGRPILTWSGHAARRILGHYDAAHNTIVISKIFDRPRTPRYAIEYLVYHEMLHLKHPVKLRGSQRCIHPPAFQQEERAFPELAAARAYLKRL
jgi:predicted metal-dependent hydrolase